MTSDEPLDEPLMDVAVQAMLFLELSDERAVDPDAAVAMLEQIAATLARLDAADKERFLRYLAQRAALATSNQERQTIENLASDLGLAAD